MSSQKTGLLYPHDISIKLPSSYPWIVQIAIFHSVPTKRSYTVIPSSLPSWTISHMYGFFLVIRRPGESSQPLNWWCTIRLDGRWLRVLIQLDAIVASVVFFAWHTKYEKIEKGISGNIWELFNGDVVDIEKKIALEIRSWSKCSWYDCEIFQESRFIICVISWCLHILIILLLSYPNHPNMNIA